MSKVTLPAFINREELKKRLVQILDMADAGLKKRGYGEEIYLTPLYERAESLLSPARKMYEGIKAGKSVEDFIKSFS